MHKNPWTHDDNFFNQSQLNNARVLIYNSENFKNKKKQLKLLSSLSNYSWYSILQMNFKQMQKEQ